MRGIPTEANMSCTTYNPRGTANGTCIRKPTSCDTCFAEVEDRDGGHAAKSVRSFQRSCGANVTVSASVPTIKTNTSSRVSQFMILLSDKRGESDALRSSSRRNKSNTSDCPTRRQRRPSSHKLDLDQNTVVDVVPHETFTPGVVPRARHRLTTLW